MKAVLEAGVRAEAEVRMGSSTEMRAPVHRAPLRRSWSATWQWDVLLVLLVVAGVVGLHLLVSGVVPSGGDGGNWLALAGERFGEGSMSAAVSYPPLLPTLLAGANAVLGDGVIALVTVALLAKAAIVVAVYVCARTLGRPHALAAAVLVGTAGALLEAYAWGAYTQLMAMGFGLVATFMVVGYLNTRERRHLWMGIVFSVATILTHTMIGALLGPALIVAVLHQIYMTDPRGRERTWSLKVGFAVAFPVLAISILGFIDGALAGFEPTINPIELSRVDGLLSLVRDAPFPWVVLALVAVAVLRFRFWPEHVALTIAVGSSWLIAGIVLFLVTSEPRALLVSQVALVLLAVVGFGALYEWARPPRGRRQSASTWSVIRHRLLVVGAISVTAGLIAGGLNFYATATDWYRVVDKAEIAALDRLAEVSQPGDLVVAATGHHGNPVGWWVEGYAERPTYTSVNINFLAFPDEREQAEIANEFFNDGLTLSQSIALLVDIGAQYVVVDKRGPDAAWLDSDVAQSFILLDDTSNIVVLRAPIET